MNIFVLCAVNYFVIISGYAGINAKYKFKFCRILAASCILYSSYYHFFERMEIKSQALIKIVSVYSPLAFSVYLIHVHPLVWERVFPNLFVSFSQFPIPLMLLAVIGTAAGIYIVCSLIDAARDLLFKALKVKERLRKIENRLVGDTWDSNRE